MEVARSEVVSLLGRNGMGKTTTIASIMGLVPIRSGKIVFESEPIHRLPPYLIARRGLGLVPEGRRVFATLTVRENLQVVASAATTVGDPWTMSRVLDLFPQLKERLDSLACWLSGGEQQMLAIGRALTTNPLMLILDEATEGLAPLMREQIWQSLTQLKGTGMSIIVIDKNVEALLKIAARHYILEKGRIVWSGNSDALRNNAAVRSQYLSVSKPNPRVFE